MVHFQPNKNYIVAILAVNTHNDVAYNDINGDFSAQNAVFRLNKIDIQNKCRTFALKIRS